MKAVGPGTVLQAAEAEAGSPDFALRPIDQVSQIIPVSILTPDLELAPFREAPPSYRGSPADSAVGDSVIAFVDEPAGAEDVVSGHRSGGGGLRPPDTLIAAALLAPAPPLSTPVPAVPPDAATPTLMPVENVAPDAGAPDDKGNPHGDPPAVGNPHGDPPGHTRRRGARGSAETEGAACSMRSSRSSRRMTSLLTPLRTAGAEPEQELPPVSRRSRSRHPPPIRSRHTTMTRTRTTPDADVVTPTPSIVAPDENIFVPAEPEPAPGRVSPPEEAAASTPPESSDAPLPSLPPTRPPEDVPGPVTTETPTTE